MCGACVVKPNLVSMWTRTFDNKNGTVIRSGFVSSVFLGIECGSVFWWLCIGYAWFPSVCGKNRIYLYWSEIWSTFLFEIIFELTSVVNRCAVFRFPVIISVFKNLAIKRTVKGCFTSFRQCFSHCQVKKRVKI